MSHRAKRTVAASASHHSADAQVFTTPVLERNQKTTSSSLPEKETTALPEKETTAKDNIDVIATRPTFVSNATARKETTACPKLND